MRNLRRSAYLTLILALSPAALSQAAQKASFHVHFEPEKLGHGTTITFAIHITGPKGRLPAPLTAVSFQYPRTIGVALSGLGLKACSRGTLKRRGPHGCPRQARMGQGTVLSGVQIGDEIVYEHAKVTVFRAPETSGRTTMFFNAEGWTPIVTQLVLPGVLTASPNTGAESIDIHLPLLEAFPESNDISVTRIQATIGPHGITYYQRSHGKLIPYKPKGILLPKHCPPEGFRFAARLSFADSTTTTARATIACPFKLNVSAAMTSARM